jgi:phosphate:Na+ symporter
MVMAKKMIKQELSFSEQGNNDLTELHGKVLENIDRMITAFREENVELAKEIIEFHSDVDENKYQLLHIKRLHKWIKPSIDTSSIHLDMIDYYARINDHIVAIANKIIKFAGEKNKEFNIESLTLDETEIQKGMHLSTLKGRV